MEKNEAVRLTYNTLGIGVSCVLWVCRWEGKYGDTLGDELAADQKS